MQKKRALSHFSATLAPCAVGFVILALGCGESSEGDDDGAAGMKGHAGSGSAGMKAMATCPDAGEAVDPTALIDDLEDGDAYISDRDGRSGAWWTAADDTLGGSMVPEQTDISGELATPEPLAEERCGSLSAMRVSGQGFTDWGAALGANLAYGALPSGGEDILPYDASPHTGVEFWARIGDTSTDQVRFQVSDSNSEPVGGKCSVDGGPGIGCYDSFGTDLPGLDTTWRRFKIPFAGLSQRDFGIEADGVVTHEIYQVSFNFLSSTPFDFWVDDVAFY